MSFFGSSSSKPVTSSKMRPTVVRTQNVLAELKKLAKANNKKVDSIDFNILDIQTFTKIAKDKKEVEWEEVSKSMLHEVDDKTALLNNDFHIKQVYEIEFFEKSKEQDIFTKFKTSIGANKSKCKIYLSIKEGSEVKYSNSFAKELLNLINKSKLKAGILVNIFDNMLDDEIDRIAGLLRRAGKEAFREKQTMLIAQSYEPTATIDGELIIHFDKKEDIDDNKKIDYSSRGFIKSVVKDELLLEYIKPKLGIIGRDCRGEIIMPSEPVVKESVEFTTDESIRKEESNECEKYFANENGYIALEGKEYVIKTDVSLDEISFKTTGSISTGLESDVVINVQEKDMIKDAIGTGMVVEVSEIEIDGNVGSGAKVTAVKASVGGQTHRTATVNADELNINVHKGTASGKDIHITRLEHGVVDGSTITIGQALGGTITAKEVTIDLCASHVKVTASKYIEIKKLQGSENIFTIDPLLNEDIDEGLHNNEEKIKELKKIVRDLTKKIELNQKLLDENENSFKEIKRRLLHYRKNGVKMPQAFVNKYKQFQKLTEKLKEEQLEYKKRDEELKSYTLKKSSFQHNIFDARIVNRDRWKGHNELIFKLVDPAVDIKFTPKEGSNEKVFALVEVEEGEFKIKAVEE